MQAEQQSEMAFPFYELRFIMRVLSHEGKAPREDWKTAYGMAREIFVRWSQDQQSERERFEAWCKQDNPRYEPTDDSPLNRRDWKIWQAALSHPSTPQGWKPLESLDLNVFAEICYNAHIDFSLDKFPSYERAIEHYYISMLNAINAPPPPEQGSKG